MEGGGLEPSLCPPSGSGKTVAPFWLVGVWGRAGLLEDKGGCAFFGPGAIPVWTLLSLLNRLALFRTVNSHADRLTVCSTKSSHTTQSTTPAENVVNRQVPGAVCRL